MLARHPNKHLPNYPANVTSSQPVAITRGSKNSRLQDSGSKIAGQAANHKITDEFTQKQRQQRGQEPKRKQQQQQ